MVGHFRPLKTVNISSKTKNWLSRENSAAPFFFFLLLLNKDLKTKKKSKSNPIQATYAAKYSLYITAPGFRLAEKASPVNKIFQEQLS